MTASQEPFLTNSFGDRYLGSVNGEDFVQTEASALFEQGLGPVFFRENTLHIVLGTDSGLLPQFVHQNGVPKGARYLFIETDELLPLIQPNLPPPNPRLIIARADEAFTILDATSDLGETFYFYLNNVRLHHSVAAQGGRLPQYHELQLQLEEEIQVRTFVHQGRGNQRSQLLNMLLNAPLSYDAASTLHGLFRGKTLVILAAGHSMTTQLDWVKTHRPHLVVVAISRVCHILHHHQIEPDIIVSMDPFPINFQQSLSMLRFPEAVLAYTPHCNHSLISVWPGRKVVLGKRLPWPNPLNEEFVSSYDITVTNTAIDLAYWLSASQIIFLGVDLCHDGQGQIYAETDSPLPQRLNTRLQKARNNAGQIVFSTQDYLEAGRGIGEQAESFQQQGGRCINPNPGSLALPGIEHLPLTAVTPEPMEIPAKEQLQQQLPEPQKEAYWKTLGNVLQKATRDLKAMEKEITQGQSLLKSIRKGTQGKKNPFDKLRKLNQYLGEDPLADLVKRLHWRSFAEISLRLEAEETGSALDNQAYYLTVFLDCLKKAQAIIRIPMQSLDLLRQEAAAPANQGIDVIKWGKHLSNLPLPHQYGYDGICFSWIANHADKYGALSAEWRQPIDACAQLFEERIDQGLTPPTLLTPSKAEISQTLEKTLVLIHRFLEQQDREAMEALSHRLKLFPDEIAKPYQLYCQGLEAELRNDIGNALEAYQGILETPDAPTLKLALTRVATLCLHQQDVDNAMVALDALSQLDPTHHKQLAELYRALGQPEPAIDSYARYLDHFPHDLTILPKLAPLLLTQGHAQQLFDLCDALLRQFPNQPLLTELRQQASANLPAS